MHGYILENADQLIEHVKQDVRIRTTRLQGVVNDFVNSLICQNWELSLICNWDCDSSMAYSIAVIGSYKNIVLL